MLPNVQVLKTQCQTADVQQPSAHAAPPRPGGSSWPALAAGAQQRRKHTGGSAPSTATHALRTRCTAGAQLVLRGNMLHTALPLSSKPRVPLAWGAARQRDMALEPKGIAVCCPCLHTPGGPMAQPQSTPPPHPGKESVRQRRRQAAPTRPRSVRTEQRRTTASSGSAAMQVWHAT